MIALNLLTANIHMGFSFSRRRFVLPELREAIREVSADVVFLQEVQGAHSGHARRHARWPDVPHYEFLADSLWPQFAYGQNAAYPHGHHGNALLSKFPIVQQRNLDVSVDGHEGRGLLHCVLEIPGSAVRLHTLCVHLGLRESHRRRQLDLLCRTVAEQIPVDAPLAVAGDFNDWRGRGHAAAERTEPDAPPSALRTMAAGRRLLLVEDDPGVASVAQELLEGLGFEVRTAENGPQALEGLQQEHFDIMLTDVVMPGGMTGIELAHQCARTWPHLRIVLTSGYAGDDVDAALADAPWAFIRKPYSGEQLAAVLGDAPPAKPG